MGVLVPVVVHFAIVFAYCYCYEGMLGLLVTLGRLTCTRSTHNLGEIIARYCTGFGVQLCTAQHMVIDSKGRLCRFVEFIDS